MSFVLDTQIFAWYTRPEFLDGERLLAAKSYTFRTQAAAAVANAQQRTALTHTSSVLRKQRVHAQLDQNAWSDLTTRAQAVRARTFAHLPDYLQQIEAHLLARGGRVAWARNSSEACQYILQVARQQHVSQALLTKTPLIDEIGLRQVLRQNAISAQVSDFGEFLADLSAQRPSHPLVGSAHLRIDDVARIVHDKLDVPVSLNTESTARVVRGRVRQTAIHSSMSVLGIDFAVAETGMLAAFNDEGDIRLASVLSSVRIVILGLDQVAPTMADLVLLQEVHSRASRGRKQPTLLELFSGASMPGQEFHLVFVDNGRSKLLSSEDAQIMDCIQCGACFDVCPVASRVGSTPYAWTTPGPVGTFLGAQLLPSRFGDVTHASTLCGACRHACPMGIDLPNLILRSRQRKEISSELPWIVRAWQDLQARPEQADLAKRSLRLTRAVLGAKNERHWLAPWLKRWTQTRQLPLPAAESFRARWARKYHTDFSQSSGGGG